jgi:CheY-like chemotaxis protein
MGMPARILVADDDKFIHAVFGDALAGAGYTVLPAWDGEEALLKARAERPDLILLDIMMPKRDGIQVAEDLKADAATRHIPIVIVSTLANTPAAQNSRADVHLKKPVHPDDLVGTVGKLLCAQGDAAETPDGGIPPGPPLGE